MTPGPNSMRKKIKLFYTNDDLKKGYHLAVRRGKITHHGIYIGNDRVIHYDGKEDYGKNIIIETSFSEFKQGDPVMVVTHPSGYTPYEIVERAKSRLGEECYGLITNNCEHFATWCVTGKSESSQVNFAMEIAESYGPASDVLVGVPMGVLAFFELMDSCVKKLSK